MTKRFPQMRADSEGLLSIPSREDLSLDLSSHPPLWTV
jgi:hypothetical protein